MDALDRSAEKISRCSERSDHTKHRLAGHFLACPGTGVVIERSDGHEIRNGPSVLDIEFGLGLEVTIQCQKR
jgi:hypothetical protein